ncbi:hypothetical protein Lfu02_17760 [Longispora fulva]|uniref:GH25 family lysozyme M1 (1,4-beta-N-acetylmuramidase) n=1 Tax=Longispora fulva TaxID=619741 RepID=A0A8J7GWM9_9ACTN|nr:GH25 family lysozyme [Longispora fulva]MBG6140219.1 GH25 family lysozyme M1 (1,4-beta-N-acetylmuramidase) [Longispora fulva]GIG57404.1 hypothetical protein Lfu02_17760 [Longispora fulva]
MVTWLVDISNWQGDISIEQIASEGYSACVCKATEGRDYKDPWFDTYIPRVIASGMIPGAYHYLRAGDGAGQAREFYNRIAAHGGPNGWLIQLDCESDGGADEMRAWADEWNRLSGNHPFLIYSGAWWWDSHTGGYRGADLTPYVWHSRYVDGAGFGSVLYENVPDDWWTPGYGGWNTATVLQFSSHGRVAGQDIDVNAFLGSVDDLRALVRSDSTTPTPTPTGGSVTDLSYAPFGKPDALGGRDAGVLLADLWGAEMTEASPYVPSQMSARTARLIRIEQKLDAISTKLDTLLSTAPGNTTVALTQDEIKAAVKAALREGVQ